MSKKGRRPGKDNRRRPSWAERERLSDRDWIRENQSSFWPVARQLYQTQGRGAFVVDTTVRISGAGHPFAYYTLAQIIEQDDPDAQRMVQEYDPENEMVIVMLKPKERVSVYRVQVILRKDNK